MEGVPHKNPVVAGILSGIVPGLGQFYCRQWMKGTGFLIGALIADAGFGASAGFLQLFENLKDGTSPPDAGAILLRSLPLLIIAIWSVVDAVRTAQRSQTGAALPSSG
jgi:hypothetical protein